MEGLISIIQTKLLLIDLYYHAGSNPLSYILYYNIMYGLTVLVPTTYNPSLVDEPEEDSLFSFEQTFELPTVEGVPTMILG